MYKFKCRNDLFSKDGRYLAVNNKEAVTLFAINNRCLKKLAEFSVNSNPNVTENMFFNGDKLIFSVITDCTIYKTHKMALC